METEQRKEKSEPIEFSIILTVHNKESLVGKVVKSIIEHTKTPFELVVVYDGCTDRSEEVVNSALAEANGEMKKLTVVYQPDVFQIKANNAGMKAASGEYFILIDDDIIINENGWEQRIIRPFLKFDDVFAVSGRSAHNSTISRFHWLKHKAIIFFRGLLNIQPANYVGIPGLRPTEMWDIQTNPNLPRNIFAIRNICVRAPLAFRADRVKAMNYFDEAYAPYTWDDHDICYRAYKEHKWVSGAYVIDYTSKIEWGTIRNKNQGLFQRMYRQNVVLLYNRHKDMINSPRHDENRVLE